MPKPSKSLVLMHVPDVSGRRTRLASFEYQRSGRSKYLTLRGVVDAIPGAAFEITSTYTSTTGGVTIVVEQNGIMVCNVAVALLPATPMSACACPLDILLRSIMIGRR